MLAEREVEAFGSAFREPADAGVGILGSNNRAEGEIADLEVFSEIQRRAELAAVRVGGCGAVDCAELDGSAGLEAGVAAAHDGVGVVAILMRVAAVETEERTVAACATSAVVFRVAVFVARELLFLRFYGVRFF